MTSRAAPKRAALCVDLTGDSDNDEEDNKTVIKRRRKICTEEPNRKYCCQVAGCNKSFATEQHYRRHQLVHSKTRRYTCDYCQKKFAQRPALTVHRRAHTDERPFACKLCRKEFKRKDKLNDHMRRIHPGAVVVK